MHQTSLLVCSYTQNDYSGSFGECLKVAMHSVVVLLLPTRQLSEDARLARRQHYRAVRIAEKISSACKVTFLL